MQRGEGVVTAGVAGNQVQAGNRHVELGVLGVLQHEEFGSLAFDFQRDQAVITTDTVVDVHHRCAFAQFGEVLDDVLAGITTFFTPTALHDALAEQRAFRNERDSRILQKQAVVQWRDRDG